MSIAATMAGLATGGKKKGIASRMEQPREEPDKSGAAGHTQLHDHGDGTFHSITSDGEKTEHPNIGHALIHIGGHHVAEGKHLHVHQGEDGEHTSHQGAGGEVEGPHEHENIEALKQHLDQFFNEEEHESSGGGYKSGGESLFG